MQNMRDLLRSSLGRSLRELTEDDRLAAAWPVVCGVALASHGEVLSLDENRILQVRVTGPEWMQQFLHMRSALANDLARIAGVRLAGIHFEEQGRGWSRRPAATMPAATMPTATMPAATMPTATMPAATMPAATMKDK